MSDVVREMLSDRYVEDQGVTDCEELAELHGELTALEAGHAVPPWLTQADAIGFCARRINELRPRVHAYARQRLKAIRNGWKAPRWWEQTTEQYKQSMIHLLRL